ncbi:anther-specific protein LAT52 [Gossypium raimondii]|uniref:HMA domain-containing protein n=2 Tax=Gossypium raimondii TaxID=29730 RepID=A0A0D2M7C9_GOSRA|nr:anther-specific protein LAT52 [Gossypium raimondii]KJB13197.1 hypothetical protein B456_002G061500 [Gossypium raimondii]
MEKTSILALVISLVICLISSLLGFSHAKHGLLVVIGKVYCDTCRVEFETKLSQPINAKVHLECKNRTDERIVYSKDAVSDKLGMYSIPVEGDHEDELCEVRLIESPRNNCNEMMESWRKARVVLTRRDGVTDLTRQTNNLGFKIKPEDVDTKACVKVLEEMGFVVDGKTRMVEIPS